MHHLAGQLIAPFVAHQRAHQLLQVTMVGLASASPAVDLDAARIEHPVLDAPSLQPTIKPETVVAGFVAAHHSYRATASPLRFLLRLFDQPQRRFSVATRYRV